MIFLRKCLCIFRDINIYLFGSSTKRGYDKIPTQVLSSMNMQMINILLVCIPQTHYLRSFVFAQLLVSSKSAQINRHFYEKTLGMHNYERSRSSWCACVISRRHACALTPPISWAIALLQQLRCIDSSCESSHFALGIPMFRSRFPPFPDTNFASR